MKKVEIENLEIERMGRSTFSDDGEKTTMKITANRGKGNEKII